jgi:hypothetical protein
VLPVISGVIEHMTPFEHVAVPALPLVPFEEYMLLDDRPAYPMNFFLRLRFDGLLDRQLFCEACCAAVARHPLLSARIVREKRCWHWTTDRPHAPTITWSPWMAPSLRNAEPPIDLAKEPGLRISGQQSEDQTTVTFRFHHATCDGLAAFQVLGDTLTAYSYGLGETKRHLTEQPIDWNLLQERGKFGLTVPRLLRMFPRQLLGLFGACQFFVRRPVQLAGLHPKQSSSDRSEDGATAWPASLSCQFTPQETLDLRSAARNQQVTVNDLLIRDWFLTLGALQHSRRTDEASFWLRTSVPISLRGLRDRRMPAANVVSMVFLDRRPSQLDDPAELLRSIRQEMNLIQRNRLEFTFVFSLGLGRRILGRLNWLMPGEKCTASSVLTNLGGLFGRLRVPRDAQRRLTFGQATLTSVDVLAPLRPGTRLALGVFRYAGRQSATLHYDLRSFTQPEAQELLEAYRRRVCRSASSAVHLASSSPATNIPGAEE